jgi:hypothetical protein
MLFELNPLCFLTGTLIDTPTGETAVERLAVGDLVNTHDGPPQRVVWIGTGQVLARRGSRNAATPVIERKGALADNVPHADLRITKAHSLYLDDVLIPVEFLVNHRSILWDDCAQDVELYHIELESHDVLIANAAPDNANTGWHLPPKPSCAPVLTGGPVVDAVRRRLLDRAGQRPGFVLTNDPDVHLIVDGERVDATSVRGGTYAFRLPTTPDTVRLASNAAAPTELGLLRDPRTLGVAIRRFGKAGI